MRLTLRNGMAGSANTVKSIRACLLNFGHGLDEHDTAPVGPHDQLTLVAVDHFRCVTQVDLLRHDHAAVTHAQTPECAPNERPHHRSPCQ